MPVIAKIVAGTPGGKAMAGTSRVAFAKHLPMQGPLRRHIPTLNNHSRPTQCPNVASGPAEPADQPEKQPQEEQGTPTSWPSASSSSKELKEFLSRTPGIVSDDMPPLTILGRKIYVQDVMFYINAVYWTLLMLAVLSGNRWVTNAAHFQNLVTALLAASTFFAAASAIRWINDIRERRPLEERKKDARITLRQGFNTLFWLGFVLWYVTPPVNWIIEYTGTVGAVACLFGLVLSLSAAATVGMWSFLGAPQVPRQLVTTGPYALLRHPQGLGNMLFLIGFSLAGGSLASTLVFLAAFFVYTAVIVPDEEAALESAFGGKYARYKEHVPAFAWALLLLIVIEVVLMWKYAPFAVPIEGGVPPPKA
jgi:protein-S-isoprenylcysteine O-methyltransferase Ste14